MHDKLSRSYENLACTVNLEDFMWRAKDLFKTLLNSICAFSRRLALAQRFADIPILRRDFRLELFKYHGVGIHIVGSHKDFPLQRSNSIGLQSHISIFERDFVLQLRNCFVF